jgi:methylthioribose-1-phosphate isomerase
MRRVTPRPGGLPKPDILSPRGRANEFAAVSDPSKTVPEPHDPSGIHAVTWRDGRLDLLDQRRLPTDSRRVVCEDVEAAIHCIRDMVVRGAPAIGITAAYAAVLAARSRLAEAGDGWLTGFRSDLARLREARPTAVNLGHAVDRMLAAAERAGHDPVESLLAEARRIHAEDIAMNLEMAGLGADLLEARCSVITHCNAGALATGGLGTALGVIREAWRRGRVSRVWVGETRPLLQGARLTAWELARDGIPVTVIADGAAAQLMRRQPPGWAIVGADRVAANGDVANKIGTYALAVAARYHGVSFMVVAPSSTLDPATPDGEQIPIERREPGEIWAAAGSAPDGAEADNPAFDVTPAGLVDVLVTERGVAAPPSGAAIAALLES